MIVLSGADLVLRDGVMPGGTLVIEGDRIADIRPGPSPAPALLAGHLVVPGFVDVHVHGLLGIDTLDGPDAVAEMAARLPAFGVTAFCPTTVACEPLKLREVLTGVAKARSSQAGARVLPAHLESNFVNPDYAGAQPVACLRSPAPGARGGGETRSFGAGDILAEIERGGGHVGIVTLAPELEGAVDLIRQLVASGRRVSLGHSGATFEQAQAAIAAGARHATHLFNRMPPLGHREPGLVGAILTSPDVWAEVICDGVHVHRDVVRMVAAAKGADRMMAITDGVAAAGLPEGAEARLGGRRIRVRNGAAYLDEGTLAGSVATMDRVFRFVVEDAQLALTDAARICATTPAAALGLDLAGTIAQGAVADLVVMDRGFTVKQTYVGGRLVYSRD